MGAIVSVIAFIVLSYLGYKYVLGEERVVGVPFDKQSQMLLSGQEMFVVLLFATGLFQCGMFISTRLIVLEVLCTILLMRTTKKINLPFPLILYIIYMLWLVIGCFYSNYPIYGVRVIIKYIYPLLVALVCMKVVDSSLVFYKSGLVARWTGVLTIIVAFTPFLESTLFSGVFWYGTARAINFISLFIFSLALYAHLDFDKKKNLLLAVLFCIPCVLWVFRTSIMGTLLAMSMFCFFRYKIKSVPFIIGIFALGVACVFMVPRVNQKMFHGEEVTFEDWQSGKVNKDKINNNGREFLWKSMTKMFYQGHETFGSGTGSVQQEMYAHPKRYGGIRIPHSDYVQMRCDNGDIAVILYLATMISVIIHCLFVYSKKKHDLNIRICAITAGCSLAGVLITLYSDNTVNYSMCTLSYPLGFYGMMLGLKNAENQ